MTVATDTNIKASGIVDKLMNLYTTLKERKSYYESVAEEFDNKDLRRSIISLAQESNQYASEVCAQIHCLGGGVDFGSDPIGYKNTGARSTHTECDNMEKVCDMSENKVIILYRELLDDPFLVTGLRKMVEYQMKGFLFIISQLRLQKSLY